MSILYRILVPTPFLFYPPFAPSILHFSCKYIYVRVVETSYYSNCQKKKEEEMEENS